MEKLPDYLTPSPQWRSQGGGVLGQLSTPKESPTNWDLDVFVLIEFVLFIKKCQRELRFI